MKAVPPESRPRRRNRTAQRERLLEVLRATDAHPSAYWLHEALLPEFPSLSLGTVYRNLEVLVAEGLVREVSAPGSPTRYDGNSEPHHHFTCERCGSIQDLEIRVPDDLPRRVRRKYRLKARRYRIDFFGLCPECTDQNPDASQ